MLSTRKPIKRAGTRADLAAYLRAARRAGTVLKMSIHLPPYHSPAREDSVNIYAVKVRRKPTAVVEWFLTAF